jgi:hypothetical protein
MYAHNLSTPLEFGEGPAKHGWDHKYVGGAVPLKHFREALRAGHLRHQV